MIKEYEQFVIDFLKEKETGDTHKNCTVGFSNSNQYIEINRQKIYFDPFYIKDDGLSHDHRYFRIFTPQFGFWVLPADYSRFKEVLLYRQEKQKAIREFRQERERVNRERPAEFDEIDDDIYKCFLTAKSGLCSATGLTWKRVAKIEEAIAKVCQKNNGRYYKSETKGARFAIIFNPGARLFSVTNALKQKGYKVTTFEKVVDFFKFQKMMNFQKFINYVDGD